MRSNNQLHFRMAVEILQKQILIRSPRTARHKCKGIVSFKHFHQRKVFGLFANLQHTVETSISHHCHTTDTNLRQIAFGGLILHKQMIEIFQHIAISSSIPFKEYLSTTENGRYAIYWNTTFMKFIQIILPEFVLDEERHARVCNIQELLHIPRFIKRQIAYNVRSPVMLAHFVTGRREKSKQYLIIGIFFPNHFY